MFCKLKNLLSNCFYMVFIFVINCLSKVLKLFVKLNKLNPNSDPKELQFNLFKNELDLAFSKHLHFLPKVKHVPVKRISNNKFPCDDVMLKHNSYAVKSISPISLKKDMPFKENLINLVSKSVTDNVIIPSTITPIINDVVEVKEVSYEVKMDDSIKEIKIVELNKKVKPVVKKSKISLKNKKKSIKKPVAKKKNKH